MSVLPKSLSSAANMCRLRRQNSGVLFAYLLLRCLRSMFTWTGLVFLMSYDFFVITAGVYLGHSRASRSYRHHLGSLNKSFRNHHESLVSSINPAHYFPLSVWFHRQTVLQLHRCQVLITESSHLQVFRIVNNPYLPTRSISIIKLSSMSAIKTLGHVWSRPNYISTSA